MGYTLQVEDPQLFGSRWTTGGIFSTDPFNKLYSVQLIRPFYSPDTRWAGGFSISDNRQVIRLFEGGTEISRLRFEGEALQAFGSFAWGERYKKKRSQLTYSLINNAYSKIVALTTRPIPPDENLHRLTASLRLENLSFAEDRRIDNFVVTEDITLGSVTRFAIGRTGIPFPSAVRRFEVEVARSQAHQLAPGQYVFMRAGFQTKFNKDTITSFNLRYYNKMLPGQTIAMNFRVDYASNLELSNQYLLGGDSGLRGYTARAFSGARSLLVNLENRFFSDINILTIALGGVAFFDAGNVWEEHEAIKFSDLNTSIGLGIRLGYTKSPNSRVGRIDFGLPLNGRGLEISIGIGQQFSLN